MIRHRFIHVILATIFISGCGIPTRFVGAPVVSPKNPTQAPAQCQAICSSWGMELSGMVSMGERYSDGCICSLPGKQVSPAAAATASQIAATGVMVQEEEREAARRRSEDASRHARH